MDIKQRFLIKAIKDKNFISFTYKQKNYKEVKALKLDKSILFCDCGDFKFEEIKNLKILKDRF